MDEEGIAKRFADDRLVLTSHGLSRILENAMDVDAIIDVAKQKKVWMITDEFLREFIKIDEKLSEVAEDISEVKATPIEEVEVLKTKRVFAKEIESELVIHESSDVTGKSTCDGDIDDFIDYFNGNYTALSAIIRERPNYHAAVPINAIKKTNEDNVTIICMVRAKRESRQGYRFFDVEDPSGELTVLIPRNNERLLRAYDSILLDEVVGIEGRVHNDMFIAQDMVEPDVPVTHKPDTADVPVHMVLLSDIHIGSYLFLEKEFNRFLDWLNGKGNKRDVSEKVKYVLIAGDLVDGIGVYPGQEKELTIPDIYKQYDFLASLLEGIPDYIEVVLGMGNHDAVRNAEPQPRISKDIGAPLYELPNVHVVGNPVMVSTHGVKTLMYHGTTLDTVIGNLAECTYSAPENAMIQYLKRRHLAPTYGNDPIAPEEGDYMLIREIPDIFHCGHVHTNGYANYRGVNIINSGTWQGKTRYQEQLGHQPTPGRVPVINLQNHEVSILYFS